MTKYRGSTWGIWDLHVHTPESLNNHYDGKGDPWEAFLNDIESLPANIKVLGINDYIFIDGYRRVLEEKRKGRLAKIELILPVIELRVDKFGGTHNHLSKVNYHIVFSNEFDPDVIQQQFLNALPSKYVLLPEYDYIRENGKWGGLTTQQSLEDLGQLIIQSVPEKERGKFNDPLTEGFNNLCFKLDAIQEVLKSPYFKHKVVTGVGKTEWANIKWNDHSIADKKNIINSADFVFVASETPVAYFKAKESLKEAGVNYRLLDCSDAHYYSDSENKDRLGQCYTWMKGESTFEGLRQALFEYNSRVHIGNDSPIPPLLSINEITLKFPKDTKLEPDPFCLRNETTVQMSPNYTCIIGGRGTGKSTLLNLIHEKLYPGENRFFEENELTASEEIDIAACVHIDGDKELQLIEFLGQSEIEDFAVDQVRFTNAIFTRLEKLDSERKLNDLEQKLQVELTSIDKNIDLLASNANIERELERNKKELQTNKKLLSSLQDDEYLRLNSTLSEKTKELQSIQISGKKYRYLIEKLRSIIADRPDRKIDNRNQYDELIDEIYTGLSVYIGKAGDDGVFKDVKKTENELSKEAKRIKQELDKFLQSKGLSEENLSDVSRAGEKISLLEHDIGEKQRSLERLSTQLQQFSFEDDAVSNYEKLIRSQLKPMNMKLKSLSSEVKPIELEYEFDEDRAKQQLLELVNKSLPREENLRADYIENILFQIDPKEVDDIKVFLDSLKSKGKQLKTSDYLYKHYSQEPNFEIYKLLIKRTYKDITDFRKINVLYDGRLLSNSSFGQRCTAAIVILLLLGNNPIIIDEPEAHLDSSLIANYLVELLKKQKNHRQIIFATHNANFVINGDADLIHVLSMDGNNRTQIESITIENLKHRDKLLALEGGDKAFKQRERRYSIG